MNFSMDFWSVFGHNRAQIDAKWVPNRSQIGFRRGFWARTEGEEALAWRQIVWEPILGPTWSDLGAILGPFWDLFSMFLLIDLLVRFLDHFWTHVGRILGAKMESKSMKNRFKNRSKFQSDFGVVLGPFWINFGSVLRTLGPQKWSSRVGEVLFSRKSRFLGQMRFWMDF